MILFPEPKILLTQLLKRNHDRNTASIVFWLLNQKQDLQAKRDHSRKDRNLQDRFQGCPGTKTDKKKLGSFRTSYSDLIEHVHALNLLMQGSKLPNHDDTLEKHEIEMREYCHEFDNQLKKPSDWAKKLPGLLGAMKNSILLCEKLIS